MPVKFTLAMTGNIRGLKALLSGNELYHDAQVELLEEVGKKGVELLKAGAPYAKGGLREGIKFRPLYTHRPMAIEFQSTTKRDGFNYPWHLNYAPRWHHVGWFTRPLESLGSVIQPMFRTAMSKIERKWASFAQRAA